MDFLFSNVKLSLDKRFEVNCSKYAPPRGINKNNCFWRFSRQKTESFHILSHNDRHGRHGRRIYDVFVLVKVVTPNYIVYHYLHMYLEFINHS